MKRTYVAPMVEKIAFDYKVQIATSTPCVESIMNIRVGDNACGEGTPIGVGWTEPQTSV